MHSPKVQMSECKEWTKKVTEVTAYYGHSTKRLTSSLQMKTLKNFGLFSLTLKGPPQEERLQI